MQTVNTKTIDTLLNEINQLIRLNKPVEDVAKAIRLSIATHIVVALPRPQNDVSAEQYFNFELKASVMKSLDVINEVYPFNLDLVLALARGLYCSIHQRPDNVVQAIFIGAGKRLCGIPEDYRCAANMLVTRTGFGSVSGNLPFPEVHADD